MAGSGQRRSRQLRVMLRKMGQARDLVRAHAVGPLGQWRLDPSSQLITYGDNRAVGALVQDRQMKRRPHADQRAIDIAGAVGRELRASRLASGLGQRAVAAAAGIAQSRVSMIERGRSPTVTIRALCHIADVVGLDISMRCFPSGDPIRDRAQIRLLARLRPHSERWAWSLEVPLPIPGDRRAWDAVLRRGPVAIAVEAETRPTDLQALLRRVALKRRDGRPSRLVLLLADTPWNRALVDSYALELRTMFPVPPRRALRALRAGEDTGGDAVILL